MKAIQGLKLISYVTVLALVGTSFGQLTLSKLQQQIQSSIPKIFSEKKNLITQAITPAERQDWNTNIVAQVEKFVNNKASQYDKSFFQPLKQASFEFINRLQIIHNRYLPQIVQPGFDYGIEIDSKKINDKKERDALAKKINVANLKKYLPEISDIINKSSQYQSNVVKISNEINNEKERIKNAWFEANKTNKLEALDALYTFALALEGNYKKLFNDLNTLKILRGQL